MPGTFNRERAKAKILRRTAAYEKGKADLVFLREQLYESIEEGYPSDNADRFTVRELAALTGLTFSRIAQILRGE